jgi:tungstate transport system ATP-binding protein
VNGAPVILEAKDLQVTRGGALVLDIPSMRIEEGEILSLIGPNGAVKTTLLQALARLIEPSRGELYFKGEKVSSDHSALEYRRRLAMVFQEPLLFDTTVFENVASGLKIRGIGRAEIRELVHENLERFGISHLKKRSARKISGGEAQRAVLARAFAIHPDVLFLDEPFASLDSPTRESLLEDLESILRQTGTTTIIATHDRMEALRLSDRIAVMNSGRILQIAPAAEVMDHPLDEFVASFVGMETILTGRVIKKNEKGFVASVMSKEVEAAGEARVGETVIFCIRPEHVTLAAYSSGESLGANNLFQGKVLKITHMGFYYKVQIDCGFPLVAYITSQSVEDLSLCEGKEVEATFRAASVHVMNKKGGDDSLTGSGYL